jgi:CheY-like chemotaxis protein
MMKDSTPLRILIVEDNPGDQLIVEEYLHDHLVHPLITCATNFGETVELLEAEAAAFDVILLDLTLPDISKETLIV